MISIPSNLLLSSLCTPYKVSTVPTVNEVVVELLTYAYVMQLYV